MKVRNSCVVQCRKRKKTEDSENVCFKALANRFWLTWKSCSWFNKVVPDQTSIKWIPWKGNDMLLKVDTMYILLRKSSWKWSLLDRGKKRGMIIIINGFKY